MPIFVKGVNIGDPSDHTWHQANNPTSKLLYARVAGVWRSAGNVWLERGGLWPATDYVGVPNAPTALSITSAANNFTTMSFSWTAPVGGAPVHHYHFIFYHQDGTYWDSTTVNAPTTTLTWGAGQDTYYQMEVTAVSAAGVESLPSNRVKYHIGHPQQTRQDPVYGWGGAYDATPSFVYASTTAVISGTTYWGSRATDNNFGTYWAGGSRSSTTYMDGLRVSAPSSYRRLYSVRVWPAVNHRIWLGLAFDGGWYGGQTGPTNVNLWFDANARYYFAHNYLYVTPSNWPANTEYEFVIGNEFNFTLDRSLIDVAVDELKSLLSGTRAALTEIIFRLQDWVVVGYNTVVTVNQVNNSYW